MASSLRRALAKIRVALNQPQATPRLTASQLLELEERVAKDAVKFTARKEAA